LAQRDVLQGAIHFVGGRIHQRGTPLQRAQRLKQVQGALKIDLEIVAWIRQAGGYRDLGGEMKHLLHLLHRVTQGIGVANV
jgi:hypothetical protein